MGEAARRKAPFDPAAEVWAVATHFLKSEHENAGYPCGSYVWHDAVEMSERCCPQFVDVCSMFEGSMQYLGMSIEQLCVYSDCVEQIINESLIQF